MKTNTHLCSHLAEFFLECKIFPTNVIQKIETHMSCSVTFVENRAVYEMA